MLKMGNLNQNFYAHTTSTVLIQDDKFPMNNGTKSTLGIELFTILIYLLWHIFILEMFTFFTTNIFIVSGRILNSFGNFTFWYCWVTNNIFMLSEIHKIKMLWFDNTFTTSYLIWIIFIYWQYCYSSNINIRSNILLNMRLKVEKGRKKKRSYSVVYCEAKKNLVSSHLLCYQQVQLYWTIEIRSCIVLYFIS